MKVKIILKTTFSDIFEYKINEFKVMECELIDIDMILTDFKTWPKPFVQKKIVLKKSYKWIKVIT